MNSKYFGIFWRDLTAEFNPCLYFEIRKKVFLYPNECSLANELCWKSQRIYLVWKVI